MIKKVLPILITSALGLLFYVNAAQGATLYLSTKSPNVTIGDRVEVDIKIDSEDVGFNAAQATLQFPTSVLEVVELDRTGSVFNFWLEDPSFSNQNGTVSFIGGSTSGFAGKSLQILKIVFDVKGSGEANLVFTDGAVTASDGSGTNILSALQGIKIASVPKQEVIELAQPVQIERPAAPAARLPQKPEVEVVLYPDTQRWYNLSAPFFARWELPEDVTDVAAVLNKQPTFATTRSEGLFESKEFPPLDDGVWYLHVRFRNNRGWGPVNSYRLAVDTTPPAPFTIEVDEGIATDIPQPTLNYQSADGLSGLSHYLVKINGLSTTTTATTFKTPLLKSFKYFVIVRAVDNAGNSTESNMSLEILPIKSPTIAEVTKDLFVGEGGLEISGTGLPLTKVLLTLATKAGQTVIETSANVDESGNWSVKIDQPLKRGGYFIEAVSQDERGALSLPIKSDLLRVRTRPLFTIGNIGITQTWFFVGLIIILLGGFAIGWLSNKLWRKQLARKVVIAQRDVVTAFNVIDQDLNKALKAFSNEKIDKREAEEIMFLLKRLRNNIEKMQKYVIDNIEDIPK